jgi:hypothetical protein
MDPQSCTMRSTRPSSTLHLNRVPATSSAPWTSSSLEDPPGSRVLGAMARESLSAAGLLEPAWWLRPLSTEGDRRCPYHQVQWDRPTSSSRALQPWPRILSRGPHGSPSPSAWTTSTERCMVDGLATSSHRTSASRDVSMTMSSCADVSRAKQRRRLGLPQQG